MMLLERVIDMPDDVTDVGGPPVDLYGTPRKRLQEMVRCPGRVLVASQLPRRQFGIRCAARCRLASARVTAMPRRRQRRRLRSRPRSRDSGFEGATHSSDLTEEPGSGADRI